MAEYIEREAAKSAGVGLPTMSAHLNGKTENCAGLHWRFDRRVGDPDGPT